MIEHRFGYQFFQIQVLQRSSTILPVTKIDCMFHSFTSQWSSLRSSELPRHRTFVEVSDTSYPSRVLFTRDLRTNESNSNVLYFHSVPAVLENRWLLFLFVKDMKTFEFSSLKFHRSPRNRNHRVYSQVFVKEQSAVTRIVIQF